MRALVLLPPPPEALPRLPPAFRTRLDQAALRSWLGDAEAAHHLSAVAPDEPLHRAVARVLELDADREGKVLVAYLGAHAELDERECAALGVGALEDSERELGDWLTRAAEHFAAREWDQARAAYRQAEVLTRGESSARRSAVLGRLGRIEMMVGSRHKAIELFDHALALNPDSPIALRDRATLAEADGEHALATAMLYRLLPTIADQAERLLVLDEMVSAALDAARDAFLRALSQKPAEPALLEKLRDIHSAAGRWDQAAAVAVELAKATADPAARALGLVAAANLCRDKLGDTARAVELYEAAMLDDPTVPGAFAAIDAALVQARDHAGLVAAYERQLARLGAEAEGERVGLLKRLAVAQRDKLGDARSAVRALERALTLRPGDVESLVMLADLHDALGETTLALRSLEAAARHAPAQPEIYRKLAAFHAKSGEEDRLYAACTVLVALGEAHESEQHVYARGAPQAVLTPKQPLDDALWEELLPEGHDVQIDAILSTIEAAAIDGWMEQRETQMPPLPDARQRQDPRTTTVMAVRCFAWAGDLLGVPPPAVYADPQNARVAVVTLTARERAVLIGRALLTERSVAELAFVAALQVARLRSGWRLVTYYPEARDLNALLVGAMAAVRPDLGARAQAGPATTARKLIEKRLDPAAAAALGRAVGELIAAGAQLDLTSWRRSMETACCRAALLASGDVTVAGRMLSLAGGRVAGVSAADKARELYAFSVSQRYAALRVLLGLELESPPESP
jgi:tetratricopeptide (TPR) repeat protein